MKKIKDLFVPNKHIDRQTYMTMVVLQGISIFAIWIYLAPDLIPRPLGILQAWVKLASTGGLIQDLYQSTKLCFNALMIAIVTSLLIAYINVLPFFKPFGFVASKARFLPMIGLSFVFTLLSSSGYGLKLDLLVFGMSVFIVESMLRVVNSVTTVEYNHARTIFGSEWRVVYERVVLGKAHEMLNAVKQNFAIVWTMLTFAEGLVRSDGGVGAMMLNENKHLQLDAVFAIQMSLFFMGILIDYLFGLIRRFAFPYADLAIETK